MTTTRRAGLAPAVIAAVAGMAGCSGTSTPTAPATQVSTPTPAASTAAGAVDATARRVLASVKVGAKIGPLAVGDNWIWATNLNATVVGQGSNGTTPSLMRIDPTSDAVSATLQLPSNPSSVLVAGGVVHIALSGALVEVDPATMHVTAQYTIPGTDPADSMATSPGALWLGFPHAGTVVRFDLARHAVTATVTLTTAQVAGADQEGGDPGWIVVAGGSVWATVDAQHRVARIDVSSGRVVATYALPADHSDFSAAAPDGSIWLDADGHVAHLDTATGVTTVLHVDVPGAGPMVLRGNDLWVEGAGHRLFHVDVAADRVVDTVAVTGGLVGLADDGGTLWVASLANNLTRINAL